MSRRAPSHRLAAAWLVVPAILAAAVIPTTQSPIVGAPVTPRAGPTDLRLLPRTSDRPPARPGDVGDLRSSDTGPPAVSMGELAVEATRAGVLIRRAGAVVAGPLRVGSLWAAGAEPCGVATESAPVVRVDPSARRWLVAQFPPATRGSGLAACVAVSRSPDADTGGWWLYDFTLPDQWRRADLVVDGAAWVIVGDGTARATLDTAAMLAGQQARYTLSPP